MIDCYHIKFKWSRPSLMLVSVNRGKFNKEDGSVTSQTEGLLSELFFLINPLINNAIDRKIIHSLHNTDIYLIQEAVDFFSRNTVRILYILFILILLHVFFSSNRPVSGKKKCWCVNGVYVLEVQIQRIYLMVFYQSENYILNIQIVLHFN